jgi:hypothetical protein
MVNGLEAAIGGYKDLPGGVHRQTKSKGIGITDVSIDLEAIA